MKNNINIGCSSFYNTYWKGLFYPIDMPRSQWFDFYCSYFNTYEINATFYKFPTLRVMQNWYNKAPEGFLYSVKVPKQITHIKKLADCKDDIAGFYTNCIEGLKEKLGCILFQLPPSFKYTADNLELVLQSVNTEFNNVIEFRNISWFIQDVYDALKKHNITFCSVGHPTLPHTVIHTTSLLYIRLHGSSKRFIQNIHQKNYTHMPPH